MKPISISKRTMKKKAITITGIVILILLAIGVLVYNVNQWSQTHIAIARTPVILQTPIVIEEVKPDIEVVEIPTEIEPNEIVLRVSHYYPDLGGTNCANYVYVDNGKEVRGECRSKMANGEPWQEWVGVAIACPKELDFGTKIRIGDREWICKDRGSKITLDKGAYWIDQLTPYALYDYGEVVVGEIVK